MGKLLMPAAVYKISVTDSLASMCENCREGFFNGIYGDHAQFYAPCRFVRYYFDEFLGQTLCLSGTKCKSLIHPHYRKRRATDSMPRLLPGSIIIYRDAEIYTRYGTCIPQTPNPRFYNRIVKCNFLAHPRCSVQLNFNAQDKKASVFFPKYLPCEYLK